MGMELSEESAAGNRILRLRDAEAINKRVQKFANITANIFFKIVKNNSFPVFSVSGMENEYFLKLSGQPKYELNLRFLFHQIKWNYSYLSNFQLPCWWSFSRGKVHVRKYSCSPSSWDKYLSHWFGTRFELKTIFLELDSRVNLSLGLK